MLVCWYAVPDVGAVPELSASSTAVWVGVDLDEPVGKHAGSVLGKSYFTARGGKHGTFVKPANVSCGDFPEIDPFDDEGEGVEEAQDEQQQQSSSGGKVASQPQPNQSGHEEKSNLYEEL